MLNAEGLPVTAEQDLSPVWVPDYGAAVCMHCRKSQFTVLNRRVCQRSCLLSLHILAELWVLCLCAVQCICSFMKIYLLLRFIYEGRTNSYKFCIVLLSVFLKACITNFYSFDFDQLVD